MISLRLSVAMIAVGVLVTSLISHARNVNGIVPSHSVGLVRPSVPMLSPRSGHSATLLPDGTVLIAGGMRRNQDFYRSAEIFDPATDQFHAVGDMSIARVGQSAVLIPSGKVLVFGGWIGRNTTDSVEQYDPATQKFAVVGKMTTKRAHPSATLLANGDVLIAGGNQSDGPSGIASAELYHPVTQSTEALEPMHVARVLHTATLLKDGRVLIAGGRGMTRTQRNSRRPEV
jgi:hypothetical protein